MKVFDSPPATRTRERSIPARHPRRPRQPGLFAGYAVLAVMSVALLTACNGQGDDQASGPSTSATTTSASPQAGVSAPPATATLLTDREIEWISGAETLMDRLGMVQSQQHGTNLTKDEGLKLAAAMRACGTGLAKLGTAPTPRLKPAYDLFVAGCDRYDQAAACMTTIANSPATVSQSEARKLTEAADCVTAAQMEAVKRLGDGLQKLEDIKLAATDGAP